MSQRKLENIDRRLRDVERKEIKRNAPRHTLEEEKLIQVYTVEAFMMCANKDRESIEGRKDFDDLLASCQPKVASALNALLDMSLLDGSRKELVARRHGCIARVLPLSDEDHDALELYWKRSSTRVFKSQHQQTGGVKKCETLN